MATSDNVVRAGLTPKVKDVDTLVNMLTYRAFSPADITFKGSPWVREDGTAITSTTLYDTPIPEFAVLRTILPANKSEHFDGMHGPSLLLVTEGRGAVREDGSSSQINVTSGNVLFIGAREAVTLQAVNDSGLTVFRAFTTDKRCARLSQ